MKLQPETIRLRNGQTCILRSLEVEEAEKMIHFLKQAYTETAYLARYPEEVNITLEDETAYIKKLNESETDVFLAVFIDDEIIGNLGLHSISSRLKMKHRCSFGITVLKKAWGNGIGTLLLQKAKELAETLGYEQMELEVAADNERAIALYKKMGFEETGNIPHAFKYKDGTYSDFKIMVCFFR